MALSANTLVDFNASQETVAFEVEAAKHIYTGALLGKHVATGYVRPFQVCDEFVGIAQGEKDNSSGSSGALSVDAITQGDFVFALTGVTRADVHKAVYATADNALALTGHALAFVGRIVGVYATNKAIVRLKQPGELPDHSDKGTLLTKFGPWTKATGNNGLSAETVDGDGVLVSSALGLGVIPAYQGVQLSLDNTDEAAHASLVSSAKYLASKGIVAKFKIAAYSTSGNAMTGANVDFEFGLGDTITRTAVDPTYHVRCHVDGAGTTLLLGGDDDTTDVAEADTGLDLPKTLATAEEYTIIIRPTGEVEVYNGATAISTPDLTALDFSAVTSALAGYINVEKSGAAGIAIVEVVDFEIFGGR